jgi:hypothetical protein
MEIRSKQEFYRLWRAGCLGNRTLLWNALEDVPADIAKVGFREIGKAGGGAWELSERAQAEAVWLKWTLAKRKFIMDGSVPNDHSVMQGEVCRTLRGLESFLAVGQALPPMRETIAAGGHEHRGYLATKVLLDHYMDPSSRDDLDSLLELYPEATVELTCFDIDTGVIPGRNVIFWEVRNY